MSPEMMLWAEISSADGFAMSMIVILTLGLGTACMVIFKVVRNVHNPLTPEDLLMEEVYREGREPEPVKTAAATENARETGAAKTPAQPWEREADWWQNPEA